MPCWEVCRTGYAEDEFIRIEEVKSRSKNERLFNVNGDYFRIIIFLTALKSFFPSGEIALIE